MAVHVEGHGERLEGPGTFVPAGMRLHSYARDREDAPSPVTLRVLATGGGIKPVDTAEPLQTIPDYRLPEVTTREYGFAPALTRCGVDVRFVGEDLGGGAIDLCGHPAFTGELAVSWQGERDGTRAIGISPPDVLDAAGAAGLSAAVKRLSRHTAMQVVNVAP